MKAMLYAIPVFFASSMAAGGSAWALAGRPVPWQMDFQDTVTPVGEMGAWFHDVLLWISAIMVLFVLGLLLYVMIRFNAKANPTPTRKTHNTLLELCWTVIPVIILVAIAIPSFRLLYFQNEIPESDMTIKAIGHQWYWSYQYPDHGGFEFESYIVPENELKPGQLRLLEVDNWVVVPVNKTVRVLVTADDVLHAFAVPSLYAKVDAVPGQINEVWFKATKEGTYYGQCSELCGAEHGFMPIRVDVVSEAAFKQWVEKAKAEFARHDDDKQKLNLASADEERR